MGVLLLRPRQAADVPPRREQGGGLGRGAIAAVGPGDDGGELAGQTGRQGAEGGGAGRSGRGGGGAVGGGGEHG